MQDTRDGQFRRPVTVMFPETIVRTGPGQPPAPGARAVAPLPNAPGGAPVAGLPQAPGGAPVVPMPQAPGLPTAGEAPAPQRSGKALPQDARESMSQGFAALDFLDTLEKTVEETGLVKGAFSKIGAALGVNDEAMAFDVARKNLKLQAQAIIKGIPSNFDVETLDATLPNFVAPESLNRTKIAASKKVVRQMVSDAIGYFKFTGSMIPDEILQQAEARGIKVASVKPFSGKGDPFAATQSTLKAEDVAGYRGMSSGELLQLLSKDGALSAAQYDAIEAEIARREGR